MAATASSRRDSQPSNIFLLDEGGQTGRVDFVKIVDFGIAKDTRGALLAESAVRVQPGASSSAQHVPMASEPEPLAQTPESTRALYEESLSQGGEDPEATAATGPGSGGDRSSQLALQLTRPDATIGTPQYMAPEQVEGGDIDARADQYALYW